MRGNVLLRAGGKLLSGLVLMGLLLFGSAGTIAFLRGWALLVLFAVPTALIGLLLGRYAPERLEKRLRMRETERAQRLVVALSGLILTAGLAVAGLDARFGWTPLPVWLSAAAGALFLAGYALYGEVLRESAFLSRSVELQEGQRLIDTGLYRAVRHPMYLATVLIFLAIPLVLGSGIAFLVFLPYPALMALRIENEEKLLRDGLEGYVEYCQRVRYRMIPYLW